MKEKPDCQFFLTILYGLRDDYSDDLPDTDVRLLVSLTEDGRYDGGNYKCRGNFITNMGAVLSDAIICGVITDSELIERIHLFLNWDFSYLHGKFTTLQEIDMINQILADVIQCLEEKNIVT